MKEFIGYVMAIAIVAAVIIHGIKSVASTHESAVERNRLESGIAYVLENTPGVTNVKETWSTDEGDEFSCYREDCFITMTMGSARDGVGWTVTWNKGEEGQNREEGFVPFDDDPHPKSRGTSAAYKAMEEVRKAIARLKRTS